MTWRRMLFAFVSSLNRAPTISFPWSTMINMGGPKYWIHRSAMHFATVSAVLSKIGMHSWSKVPQHTLLQKTIWELSGDSMSKRSKPSVSLKRKVRGNAAGNRGFGGWPLAAHAGHSNSRRTWSRTSGRARLRRRALKNEWLSSGSTSPVSEQLFHCRHHSHRQEAFRPSPSCQPHHCLGQVRAALSLPEKNKSRSSLSGQTAIVSLDVSLASCLWDFPTGTLDLLVGEQPRHHRTTRDDGWNRWGQNRPWPWDNFHRPASLAWWIHPKQRVLTRNVELARPVSGDQHTANERWRDQMPRSRIAAASSGTSSSCLISNGCSFKTCMGSCQHWLILHFIIGPGVTTPVLLMTHAFLALTLCWIGRLHTNPIRSRVHTPLVPSGSAVLGKLLPRIRCRRRHELLLILKMLILLMEELPLSELLLCPSWVCRQSLHLGRPVVYRRWILCAIVLSRECSWATRTTRWTSTSCMVGAAPLWHALINVQGVPARLHPQQRRLGPEAVLKTWSSRSHLGQASPRSPWY